MEGNGCFVINAGQSRRVRKARRVDAMVHGGERATSAPVGGLRWRTGQSYDGGGGFAVGRPGHGRERRAEIAAFKLSRARSDSTHSERQATSFARVTERARIRFARVSSSAPHFSESAPIRQFSSALRTAGGVHPRVSHET